MSLNSFLKPMFYVCVFLKTTITCLPRAMFSILGSEFITLELSRELFKFKTTYFPPSETISKLYVSGSVGVKGLLIQSLD